jgi:hypothetical protein
MTIAQEYHQRIAAAINILYLKKNFLYLRL